jgi:hypothetical protein
MVHTGDMSSVARKIRQSVSLPPNVASQVRSIAKARRLSTSRVIVEMIETGLDAEKRKQREFETLAKQFREATDPVEVKRLGEEMGRMIFKS